MIPASAFGDGDFMMVRAELVRVTGGPAEALLAAVIFWRARHTWPAAYQHDGVWWWRATREELADLTGMTLDQVRRAGSALTQSGMIEVAQHKVGGIQDRTFSYRVVLDTPIWDDAQMEVGRIPNVEVGRIPNLPSVETSKTTATRRATTMPLGLTWNNAHSMKAGAKGVDVDVEFAKFQDYHLAHGSKFVDWDRAFHTWLNNARPEIGRGSQRTDPRPSRDQEIRAVMAGSLGLDEQREIER